MEAGGVFFNGERQWLGMVMVEGCEVCMGGRLGRRGGPSKCVGVEEEAVILEMNLLFGRHGDAVGIV